MGINLAEPEQSINESCLTGPILYVMNHNHKHASQSFHVIGYGTNMPNRDLCSRWFVHLISSPRKNATAPSTYSDEQDPRLEAIKQKVESIRSTSSSSAPEIRIAPSDNTAAQPAMTVVAKKSWADLADEAEPVKPKGILRKPTRTFPPRATDKT